MPIFTPVVRMNKSVAISQSNYIPWKGYFDNIALVDEFILYDDVQYTRRDWRNRNQIKTAQGLLWLTIPVEVKGKYLQKIKDTKICGKDWATDHLKSIKINYSRAAHFKEVYPWIESLYMKAAEMTFLSDVNYIFLSEICHYLHIDTTLRFSSEIPYSSEDRNMRLIEICRHLNTTKYYSGQAAKSYMDVELFRQYGIQVEWYDYSGYSEYEQLYPPFVHSVSIIDLLLNQGQHSRNYLKYAPH